MMSRLNVRRVINLAVASVVLVIAAAILTTPTQKAYADAATDCAASGGTLFAGDVGQPSTCGRCPAGTTSTTTICSANNVGAAGACTPNGSFLGFPTWYKFLSGEKYTDPESHTISCSVKLNGLKDIWKIVAAVIEILLRVATLIAIGFVVYGGILYTISQANPEKTKQALRTIINALVGLVIAIISTVLVSYIAGRF